MLDILVSASISFGTEFSDVCRDLIEICINTANAECFLYVNDGVEDDVWGCVELSNEEFFYNYQSSLWFDGGRGSNMSTSYRDRDFNIELDELEFLYNDESVKRACRYVDKQRKAIDWTFDG